MLKTARLIPRADAARAVPPKAPPRAPREPRGPAAGSGPPSAPQEAAESAPLLAAQEGGGVPAPLCCSRAFHAVPLLVVVIYGAMLLGGLVAVVAVAIGTATPTTRSASALSRGLYSELDHADSADNAEARGGGEAWQRELTRVASHDTAVAPSRSMRPWEAAEAWIDMLPSFANSAPAPLSSTTTTTTATPRPCMVASVGDPCYKEVVDFMFALRTSASGEVNESSAHPQAGVELSNWSSFEDVQELVSARAAHPGACGRPCPCRTAQVGERCHAEVQRAREGAAATPRAYPELQGALGFEDFQRYLWKHASGAECPLPCAVPPWPRSSNTAEG